MDRPNLNTDLRARIREQIVTGALAPGARLNEVHLAAALGVSRTPVREALCGLVAERYLVGIPRRGFFVTALSVDEIRQLYVVRRLLDPEALRLAGIPDASTINRLDRLNDKIARTTNPSRIIELDDAWHLELVAGCENDVLLDLIRQHMTRTRRYEYLYVRDADGVHAMTREHDDIIAALRDGQLKLACKALLRNMSTSEGPLLDLVAALCAETAEAP